MSRKHPYYPTIADYQVTSGQWRGSAGMRGYNRASLRRHDRERTTNPAYHSEDAPPPKRKKRIGDKGTTRYHFEEGRWVKDE